MELRPMHDPIFDIFRDEAIEHLKRLEQGFLDLDLTLDLAKRTQLVGKLFRHAHNLKGDSRALNLQELQKAAAVLEETLEQFRENPEKILPSSIETGLADLDHLRKRFEDWKREFQKQEGNPSSAPLLPDEPMETISLTPAESAAGSPWLDDSQNVRVPSARLDHMLNLVGEIRVLQRSNGEIQRELRELRIRLDELGRKFLGNDRPAVELALNQVRQIETRLYQHQTREQMLMQSLEENISAARLLPLSILADSFRRPIRDLARSVNKEVLYQVDVGDVLLDKAVIESLRAPLLHLVRNAVDHGIESPDVRHQRGKPPQGVIRFSAGRRGEKVCIQIADDGAGPDESAIRHRLLSHGLLSESEINALTSEELHQWIFHPGFSTANVGEISGRGVGLDIVRDTLLRMQGQIELLVKPGQGTTFSLIIPVTLSTIRVLTVWCLGRCFGIPSTRVQRTGRVKISELREIKGIPTLILDGEPVRWMSMADFLELGQPRIPAEDQYENFVVIQQESRRLAVRVDSIEEEREVLLKPLHFPLAGVPGLLGGTIRSDGSVQLVLDASLDLVERNVPVSSPAVSVRSAAEIPRILIVDDSPTTRAMLRNVLSSAGYQVHTAIDGMDALEKLRAERPDLVVCDFEMPRLNGVDLTRQIKARWNLPVILVTGREKEHYRREGLEAGADAYVIKSTFQGEGLLDVVRQLIIQEPS